MSRFWIFVFLICSPSQILLAQSGSQNGFDLSNLDRNVSPCDNFYQFACGGWMAKNPIPEDQNRWGTFNVVRERNLGILRQILESASTPDPKRSDVMQKIGDYYASCMDLKKVEANELKPIRFLLSGIEGISKPQDLIKVVATIQQFNINAMFSYGSSPDMHDATKVVAVIDQGGLGLPDREYYLKVDPKSVETRQRYVEHITHVLQLLGDKPEQATTEAKAILEIETNLAKVAMDNAERRNPANRDHFMTVEQASALAPEAHLAEFFLQTGAPKFDSLNVINPQFFKGLNEQLLKVPLSAWKSYLRWQVAQAESPVLSKPFVDEDFAFEKLYLRGQKEPQARWKQCVDFTDGELGQALGQPYVDQTFGVEGKQRTLGMVNQIEKAMGEDIQKLDWMSDVTKKQAQVKLKAVANNIGFPDNWRDYSSLKIERGDFAGNSLRANRFEVARQLNKIGKPVDRGDWSMSPPTVNAYYRPSFNDINFPAGILQPPFYNNQADDAVNYGGIGVVIGHELTHGFDDNGSQFDPQGNFRSWWTKEDRAEFVKRTDCIADEYSEFIAVDDVHLKGRFTLGENTADNGGARVAYMAMEEAIKGKDLPQIDSFSPEQRFFLGFAQVWCQNQTPESARVRAMMDPHSPGQYRVNGVVSNMPEFRTAYGCKNGQAMVRENSCHVW